MMSGFITVSPMKPHTTDGMAASSSITILSHSLTRGAQNSETKTAAPTPNGPYPACEQKSEDSSDVYEPVLGSGTYPLCNTIFWPAGERTQSIYCFTAPAGSPSVYMNSGRAIG